MNRDGPRGLADSAAHFAGLILLRSVVCLRVPPVVDVAVPEFPTNSGQFSGSPIHSSLRI